MENQTSASKETRAVVDFLRSSKAGLKPHVGVLNGKRVEYFKGSKAVAALQSPAYAKLKGVPPVKTEEEANKVLHEIIPYAFFLRVDKGQKMKEGRVVQINQMQMFKPDLHFVWLYEGSQLGLKLAGFGMVALMLAGVMFPLWPPIMRQGVWYLSVGVLGLIGLFIALAIVRLIIYVVLLIVQKPGWLFPNLFEDVGFVESFIPVWAWEVPAEPKKKKAKKVLESGEGSTADAAKGKRQAVANLPGVGPGGGAQLNTKKAPEAAATAPTSAKESAQSNGNAPSQQHEKLDELN